MARKPTKQEAAEAYAEAQRRIKAWRPGEELDFSQMALATLPPELAGLTKLKWLNLNYTLISDLTPLAGLTGLETLTLVGAQVVDLTPLTGLTGLREIVLSNTNVCDLSPLVGLIQLKKLELTNTQVNDLTPVAELRGLRQLFLSGSPVSDLTPLVGLAELRALILDGTRVSDLTPLVGPTGLEAAAMGKGNYNPVATRDGKVLLSRDGNEILVRTGAPYFYGLSFADTPACAADPVLEALSRKNDPERTVETLAYLRRKLADVPLPAPEKSEHLMWSEVDDTPMWSEDGDTLMWADDDVPLPAPEEVGEQSGHGLVFAGGQDGPFTVVGAPLLTHDDTTRRLYAAAKSAAVKLERVCADSNSLASLKDSLELYLHGLGSSPEDANSILLIVAGKELQREQDVDEKRKQRDPNELDDTPPMQMGKRLSLDKLLGRHQPMMEALAILQNARDPGEEMAANAEVLLADSASILDEDARKTIENLISAAKRSTGKVGVWMRESLVATAANLAKAAVRRMLQFLGEKIRLARIATVITIDDALEFINMIMGGLLGSAKRILGHTEKTIGDSIGILIILYVASNAQSLIAIFQGIKNIESLLIIMRNITY